MRENGGLVAAFIFGLIAVSAYFGFAAANLGGPEPRRHYDAKQEQKPAAPILPIVQPSSGSSGEKPTGCVGTRHPDSSCDALTAEATMQQVDLAEEQADIAWWNIGLGILTAFVAGMAALFARNAARAARDTVNVLMEVEQASIAVTLDAFKEYDDGPYDPATGTIIPGKKWLSFDVLAHNLGRSTAIIVQATSGWSESQSLEGNRALLGPPRTYIVKPAESAKLDLHVTSDASKLDESRFLWVLVSYDAPLRGLRFVRYCFEVWGIHSNVPYIQRQREEWDPKEKGRKWTPTGIMQQFIR